MTLNEYDNKMSEYGDKLRELYGKEFDELYEEVSEFQQNYMENVLEEYQKTIDCKTKEVVYDLLCYAVRDSQSGNAIVDVETKEIADSVDEILWDEIGDYLLDYEIYEEGDCWAIDCMFAGNYVPYWDGWNED